MIIATPGSTIYACTVADPSALGASSIRARIVDQSGNEVASLTLGQVDGTHVYCAQATAPSDAGAYAIVYEALDSSGNVVAELGEESLIVMDDPTADTVNNIYSYLTGTIKPQLDNIVNMLNEVLNWLRYRRA